MDTHSGHLRVWALSAIVGLLGADLAIAQTVRVAGTGVSLTPPDGFSPAEQFPGFQRADLQASIVVTEIPGSLATMKTRMTKGALASQGMILLGSKVVVVDGKEALLLHLRQRAGETEFLKWMLVAGDQNTTILIVGTFPRSAESSLSPAIQASVLTASWSVERSTDLFEGLLFRVTPSSTLKIARRVSNMLLLTESGTTGPAGPDEALYIVGNSVSGAAIHDLRSFSEARATQTAQTKDVRNFNGRVIQVDGLDSYELVADAKDAGTGTAMKVYQVVVPDSIGYYIVQGLISAARAGDVLPEFRRITATFRRVAR